MLNEVLWLDLTRENWLMFTVSETAGQFRLRYKQSGNSDIVDGEAAFTIAS